MSELLLPRLYERDIDVLLQEELIFNPSVGQLFSNALDLGRIDTVYHCRLSVVDQTGETDLFVACSAGGYDCAFLIENKIDAAFQPRQPERYKERARALAAESTFSKIFCILVAPAQYIKLNQEAFLHFDSILSYEELAESIKVEDTPRARHRAALLLRAVDQARSSYILTPAAEVTGIWNRIYEISSNEYPELRMSKPNDKGSGSVWIIFKANLPKRITIDWKITKASVDLSFWKGAHHAPNVSFDQTLLPPETRLTKLGKHGDTIVIQRAVSKPPSDWTTMGDSQIKEALDTAKMLLEFYQLSQGYFS